MGAEQSSESKKREDERYQRMMNHALEKQRLQYEEKCKELLQKQQKMEEAMAHKDRIMPQLVQTQANYAPLYPNLQQTPVRAELQPATSSACNQAHSNVTSNQNKTILSQPQYSPSVSQPTNVQQSVNSVPATSNTVYNTRVTNIPVPNMPQSSASLDSQPSAPTAPDAKLLPTSQQRPSENRNAKQICPSNTYQCPTCKINNLEINIFQCLQGHSSCSQCKTNNVKCGICKSSITNTRNIELERIVANNQTINKVKNVEKVFCPNKTDGCSLSFKRENLQAHLKECIFREMECPLSSIKYSQCLWRGKINQIQAHFLEFHPQQTGSTMDTEMIFNRHNNRYIVQHVAAGNFNFLLHMKLDSNLQTLFMTIQLIGSLISASKWSYEFHVYDKSKPQRKFTYADSCLPTSIPFSDLSKENKCAALPLQYAMSFFNDNKMTYKFYIKRDQIKRRPNQRGRQQVAFSAVGNVNIKCS